MKRDTPSLPPVLQVRDTDSLLIIDDDAVQRRLLSDICKSICLIHETASNGQEALDILVQRRFSIYLVDLNMPVVNGREFMLKLNEIDSDAQIIVVTGENVPQTIIDIMKKGVCDYVLKPFRAEHMEAAIYRALERKRQRRIESEVYAVSESHLRSKLEWMTYKESRRNNSDTSEEKNAFYNLKASLSQGEGFGTIIALVEYILSSQDKNTGNFVIDESMLAMLHESIRYGRGILEGLGTIVEIYGNSPDLSEDSSVEFANGIENIIYKLKDCLEQRSLRMEHQKCRIDVSVQINQPVLEMAVEELLINACKYSKSGGHIEIFSQRVDDYFCLSVKNDIEDDDAGIPPDKEQMVIEPFFRLHPPVLNLALERFGLGLGLTVVNHIILKHHGMLAIGNVTDYSHSQPGRCVLAQIFLPIAAREE